MIETSTVYLARILEEREIVLGMQDLTTRSLQLQVNEVMSELERIGAISGVEHSLSIVREFDHARSETRSLRFSAKHIRQLAAIRADIDIDQYVQHGDGPESYGNPSRASVRLILRRTSQHAVNATAGGLDPTVFEVVSGCDPAAPHGVHVDLLMERVHASLSEIEALGWTGRLESAQVLSASQFQGHGAGLDAKYIDLLAEQGWAAHFRFKVSDDPSTKLPDNGMVWLPHVAISELVSAAVGQDLRYLASIDELSVLEDVVLQGRVLSDLENLDIDWETLLGEWATRLCNALRRAVSTVQPITLIGSESAEGCRSPGADVQ